MWYRHFELLAPNFFIKKIRVTISEQDSTPETRISEHGCQTPSVH